jgi:DNA-binding protein H-NS
VGVSSGQGNPATDAAARVPHDIKSAIVVIRGNSASTSSRNPAKPSETWAGRGNRPRWLIAALKSGKKLEAFAVK